MTQVPLEELVEFAKKIQEVLGDNLVGLYVTGSLATGHWSPHTSDIDICVVMNDSISENQARILYDIHREFAKNDLGKKLEGEYVTLHSLRKKEYSGMVWSVSGGNFSLKSNNLSNDNLFGLNENSIAIVGPVFRTLGVEVTTDELKEAEREMLIEDLNDAETEQDFEKNFIY